MCGMLFIYDVRSVADDMIGNLLKTRSRALSKTERTEFMPSSLNPSDGFKSLIAPGGRHEHCAYMQNWVAHTE